MMAQTATNPRDAEIASLRREYEETHDALMIECDRTDALHAENLRLKCRVAFLEAAYAMAQKCREAGR